MAINWKLEQRDITGKQTHRPACVISPKRGSVQTNIFTASRNIWNVLIHWGCGISRHHLENHLHVTRRWLHSRTSRAAVKEEKGKRAPLNHQLAPPSRDFHQPFFFFWTPVFIKSIAAKFHLEDKRPNITGCLVWRLQSRTAPSSPARS